MRAAELVLRQGALKGAPLTREQRREVESVARYARKMIERITGEVVRVVEVGRLICKTCGADCTADGYCVDCAQAGEGEGDEGAAG